MTTPAAPTTGLAPHVAGALAYILGPITGVLFLVIEKENRFVRFHAAQSIAVAVATIALYIALSFLGTVLAFIPVLGWIVALLLTLVIGFGTFVLWLLLMWRAFQGKEWEVPIAGGFARRIVP
jgi:uncharacterized membrane protein